MMLDFDYLDFQGFRSFRERSFIDLKEIGTGLHFVRGHNKTVRHKESNGAGKSSLWNALVWGLYGRTIQNLNRIDIKPWQDKTDTIIRIGIRRDDAMHQIERGDKYLFVNGEIASQKTIDDLVVPMSLFAHTILLGQGRPLFFDLQPAEKLSLLTDALVLERWDERSRIASLRVTELASTMTTLQNEIRMLSDERTSLTTQLKSINNQSNEWDVLRQGRLNITIKEIAETNRRYLVVRKNHDDIVLKLDGAGVELKALREGDLSKAEANYAAAFQAHQVALHVRDMTIREIDRLKVEHGRLSQGACEACGQSLSHGIPKERRDQIAKDIRKLTPKIAMPTTDRMDKLDVIWNRLKDAETGFQITTNKAQDDLNSIVPRLMELQSKLRELKTRRDSHLEESNPYLVLLQDTKIRISEITKRIKQAEAQLITNETIMKQTSFWIKGFKEVKLYQLEELLGELEIVSNAMLGEFGLPDWSIHYEIERENKSGTTRRGMNVLILSPANTKLVKWETWSGGEAQRLRLDGALALSDTLLNHIGVDVGLMILDEPTQGLSPQGINDMVDTLADYADNRRKQVFLIDQHAIESSRFQSVITITKDVGGSRIA